jgi:ribosomal-protein-alanine N-acetyltransferase
MTAMNPQPTLRTARLTLRPFVLSDAKRVQQLAGERAIADTTLTVPYPYEDGMAEQWISTHQSQLEAKERVTFAVVLREVNSLVGAIGLELCPKFERGQLGYWIGVPYWNRGYCTEAGAVILQYGFESLNLHRIYAFHVVRNPASGRVLEKLGMKREGVARGHWKKWGVYEDAVYYGILRPEWELKEPR